MCVGFSAVLLPKRYLQQAYHQVQLLNVDVPKIASTPPQRLYEYLVLPFGLILSGFMSILYCPLV